MMRSLVVKEDVMAKKRRETSTNVIAMPATESSTPALDKATGPTDRDPQLFPRCIVTASMTFSIQSMPNAGYAAAMSERLMKSRIMPTSTVTVWHRGAAGNCCFRGAVNRSSSRPK
jgi:hypothetical protein